MTKATDKYLERAKEIVLAHLEGREATVFLFGSHATGTARRASDIDIGIESRAPAWCTRRCSGAIADHAA